MIPISIIANSTHGGGAENSMISLHNGFGSMGIDSTFIAINDMDDDVLVKSSNISYLGRNWEDGVRKTYLAFKKFKVEVKYHKTKILIVNCELAEMFVAFLPLKKSKIVVVEHTTKPWANRRIQGWIVRSILRMRDASWVTVNSQENVIWPFGESATYIPNPVGPIQAGTPITKDDSVVFVGRLRKEKCPELVVQACLESSTHISLIGEGNLSAELQSRYGHSQFVEFFGYLESPWSRISPRSLVVVSSEYEGDGIVVLEALQNGNPVLLRDIADLRRFDLSDDNYFKDQAHLTEKLSEFRANRTLFNVSASERDRILRTRNISDIQRQWAVLIHDLVEGTR
jgi:glycosyltransferase involved in cell wall biosynthesis